MKRSGWMPISRLSLILLTVACSSNFTDAQTPAPITNTATNTTTNASDLLTKLDQLVEQNRRLEEQNKELMGQINSLRKFLAEQPNLPTDALQKEAGAFSHLTASSNIAHPSEESANSPHLSSVAVVSANDSGVAQEESKTWGTYTPNQGFKLANTDMVT